MNCLICSGPLPVSTGRPHKYCRPCALEKDRARSRRGSLCTSWQYPPPEFIEWAKRPAPEISNA